MKDIRSGELQQQAPAVGEEAAVVDLDDATSAASVFGRAFEVVRPLARAPAANLDLLLMQVERTTRRTRLKEEQPTRTAQQDLERLEQAFEASISRLWLATQPIVSWSQRTTVAWEVLLRSDGPVVQSPVDLFRAAKRLDRVHELSRRVRAMSSERVADLPPGTCLCVNLADEDLVDEQLYDPSSPLSKVAGQVVLEVSEAARLEMVWDIRDRIERLRRLGFMIAVDDFGAGYATLRSISKLTPDVVKLDMSLIRNLEGNPRRARLLGSVVDLCKELGVVVICEGVEQRSELTNALATGCDLFQGYAFGRPTRQTAHGRMQFDFDGAPTHTSSPEDHPRKQGISLEPNCEDLRMDATARHARSRTDGRDGT